MSFAVRKIDLVHSAETCLRHLAARTANQALVVALAVASLIYISIPNAVAQLQSDEPSDNPQAAKPSAEFLKARTVIRDWLLDNCSQWNTRRLPPQLPAFDHRDPGENSPEVSDIVRRGQTVGQRYIWDAPTFGGIRLQTFLRRDSSHATSRGVSFSLQLGVARPLYSLTTTPDCGLQPIRQILYDRTGNAYKVIELDTTWQSTGAEQLLNPAVPVDLAAELPEDGSPRTRVGLVDSGVNYLLPEIFAGLARDEQGRLIGFDFWDMDALPFDADTGRSPFFATRHGTRTASIVLREAPSVQLVPYRYPRPDMSRMRDLVEHAARNQVDIIGMPLGGNRADQWQAFAKAAAAHPEILFVVSAGNNGRDIGQAPVYPAALYLENMVVVTSSDDTIRPAERVNWGREHVDYMLPAEFLPATDFSGEPVSVSGSSYAVARMVALLARLKQSHPQWHAPELQAELRRRFADGAHPRYVSGGFIADPLAAFSELKPELLEIRLADFEGDAANTDFTHSFEPEVWVLDNSWKVDRVEKSMHIMRDTLAQCGIALERARINRLDVPDYLRDMSVGTSRTLVEFIKTESTRASLQSAITPIARIFLIRNTREINDGTGTYRYDGEAFGRGNTRSRTWLRDTVWISRETANFPLAVTHELMHVLMNSGEHTSEAGNLMNATQTLADFRLNAGQCRQAIDNGMANGLLRAREG